MNAKYAKRTFSFMVHDWNHIIAFEIIDTLIFRSTVKTLYLTVDLSEVIAQVGHDTLL